MLDLRYPAHFRQMITRDELPPIFALFELVRLPDRLSSLERSHDCSDGHVEHDSSYGHIAREFVHHKHERDPGCRGRAWVEARITMRLQVTKRDMPT